MTVYAVFASVLCGLIAPFYYYDVILLYQLSAYRLKELFTAVKRKKILYFIRITAGRAEEGYYSFFLLFLRIREG